jgi:hypothetical protein
MRRNLLAVAASAALSLAATGALAQPPATPSEIPDSWDLQSHGHVVCRLTLSGRATHGGAYGAQIPEACRGALPPGAAGWTPTPGGIALVAPDGSVLVNFDRWSESLFVSTSAGPDLQLARAPLGER